MLLSCNIGFRLTERSELLFDDHDLSLDDIVLEGLNKFLLVLLNNRNDFFNVGFAISFPGLLDVNVGLANPFKDVSCFGLILELFLAREDRSKCLRNVVDD